jgi:hypothetical protein
MMGVRILKTYSAINKRQDNKLEKFLNIVGWFIWIIWWCTDLQTLKFLLAFGVCLINRLVLYNRGGKCLLRGAHWALQKQIHFRPQNVKEQSYIYRVIQKDGLNFVRLYFLTIRGMWIIYITFERVGLKFSNITARALA